ncbi:MAG: hypothetical protein ABMA25_15725 [Ilumatobacteraceae bacterium]
MSSWPPSPGPGAGAPPQFPGRVLPPSTVEAFARYAAQQQQAPQYGAPPRKRKGKGRSVVSLLLVMVLVGGGVAGYVYRDRIFHPKAEEPPHPDVWDARAIPFVQFVERERGKPFLHPVFIDFLPEAEYVGLFAAPAGGITEEDRAAAQQQSGLYNAMAVAVGYDPLAGSETLHSVGSLGFYSPDADRLFVRGDVLTPAVRTTLVHELTHALQDQYFPLELGGEDDLQRRAIIEADAMRIEDLYVASLSPEEQTASHADSTISDEGAATLDTLPSYVTDSAYAPYLLGPWLVEKAVAAKGPTGVDELLQSPAPMMMLINVDLYGKPVTDVELVVAAPEGAIVLDESQHLSALDVLMMLDAWLPWSMSRAAVDGWTGGGVITFEQQGLVCFTAQMQMNEPTALANALTWWAGASHAAAAPVVTGQIVTITSCDRGLAAEAPFPPVSTMEAFAFEHYYLENTLQALRDAGDVRTPSQVAGTITCVARYLIDDPTTAPLLFLGQLTPEQDQAFSIVTQAAHAACPPPTLQVLTYP